MILLDRLAPYKAERESISPNHNARPGNVHAIQCVILHATADRGNERGAEEWMLNPASKVSAHLHIRRDGTATRLVPDRLRAWHAGKSEYLGFSDVNDISLGWEFANRNDGKEKYTEAQYRTASLLAVHYIRQGMPLAAFVSHESVARPVGRKNDPKGWDWKRFLSDVNALLTPLVADLHPMASVLVRARYKRRQDVPRGKLIAAAQMLDELASEPTVSNEAAAKELRRIMQDVVRFYPT